MGDLNYPELNKVTSNSNMSWEGATANYPLVYRGREVIRPLDVPNYHPLVQDSLIDDEGIF